MSYNLLLDAVTIPCAGRIATDPLTERVITVSLTGTGSLTATVQIQTHNGDGVWQPGTTITLSGSAPVSASGTLSSTNPYIRAVLSAMTGTGATLTAQMESQSTAGRTSDIPVGGTAGQILAKNSSTDGDVGWALPDSPRTVAAVADGASIAIDAALGSVFTTTLAADGHAIAAPAHPVSGKRIIVRLTQGGTGTNTVTWNSVFRFSTSVQSPTLSTSVGKVDYIEFMYNATASKWDAMSTNLGF